MIRGSALFAKDGSVLMIQATQAESLATLLWEQMQTGFVQAFYRVCRKFYVEKHRKTYGYRVSEGVATVYARCGGVVGCNNLTSNEEPMDSKDGCGGWEEVQVKLCSSHESTQLTMQGKGRYNKEGDHCNHEVCNNKRFKIDGMFC